MTTTVSSKGQVVLPAQIRDQDDIQPGQQFEIERIEAGEYRLKRVQPPANQGLVAWLRRCPEKDWFQLPDRTETTHDLKLPTFE